MSNIEFIKGNLFNSNCKTLVNTINTVGVMGKGIALEFKKRYPEMYKDYVERCEKGLVKIGEPYLWIDPKDKLFYKKFILNFPTKEHWKNPSKLEYIKSGLEYFKYNYKKWPISSISFPPLGCGNGGLDWNIVKPIMVEKLSGLDIIVKIYEN